MLSKFIISEIFNSFMATLCKGLCELHLPLMMAFTSSKKDSDPAPKSNLVPGGLVELGRGGPGAGVIGMMQTRCLLGLRTFATEL